MSDFFSFDAESDVVYSLDKGGLCSEGDAICFQYLLFSDIEVFPDELWNADVYTNTGDWHDWPAGCDDAEPWPYNVPCSNTPYEDAFWYTFGLANPAPQTCGSPGCADCLPPEYPSGPFEPYEGTCQRRDDPNLRHCDECFG